MEKIVILAITIGIGMIFGGLLKKISGQSRFRRRNK
jgi:hypothetical protein